MAIQANPHEQLAAEGMANWVVSVTSNSDVYPADTSLWHLDRIVWIWYLSESQQEPFKHLASLGNYTIDLRIFDWGSQEKVEEKTVHQEYFSQASSWRGNINILGKLNAWIWLNPLSAEYELLRWTWPLKLTQPARPGNQAPTGSSPTAWMNQNNFWVGVAHQCSRDVPNAKLGNTIPHCV